MVLACALLTAGGIARTATATQSSISLAEARVIIDTAVAFARERNLAMAVIVVDSSGNPVASERMDGVPASYLHFAEGKAFAAAMLKQTTESLSELATTRPDRFYGMLSMYPGQMYFDNGGEPLVANGVLVGAVGVSGLPRKQDEPAGRAGIAAWEKMRATIQR